MEDSRWPMVMVPVSLIFFRVPARSWAETEAETNSAAMPAISETVFMG